MKLTTVKNNLVELLKARGFVEAPYKAEATGIMLRRSWEKEVEVAWEGKRTSHYSVEVYVVEATGRCRVTYYSWSRPVKDRWYETIGKRTYNAIAETVHIAGYEF